MKIEHNLNLNSIEYVILKLNKRKEKFQHKIWDNNNNNNSINKKNCRVFWLIFIIINFQRISTMANVFFFFCCYRRSNWLRSRWEDIDLTYSNFKSDSFDFLLFSLFLCFFTQRNPIHFIQSMWNGNEIFIIRKFFLCELWMP